MADAIAELTKILREVGAVPTLDMAANVTHPCWRCGKRGPHDLYVCGVQPGNGRPKRRPFCASCSPNEVRKDKERAKFYGLVSRLVEDGAQDMFMSSLKQRSRTWRSRLAYRLRVELES